MNAAVGIFNDVSFDDYRKWEGMSKSTLDFGMVTMRHLKAAEDGFMWRETDALAFGRAFHARMLEPDKFKVEYAVVPDFPQDEPGKYKNYKASKEYKDKRAAWGKEHEGCEIVEDAQMRVLGSMGEQLRRHSAVGLLRQTGGVEASMRWEDESTGLLMKGRMDKWVPDFNGVPVIIDLKTVQSNQSDKLRRAVLEYGWHRQAAMYSDGVKAVVGKPADFIFIFIEKAYPYTVRVEPIGDDSLRLGRSQYRSLLSRWKWCVENDNYPGFGDDIGAGIDVPEWALKELEHIA